MSRIYCQSLRLDVFDMHSIQIDLRKASRRCETHRYQMVSGYAVIAQLCGLMESLIMRR